MATSEAKITFKAETADFQAQIKSANSELSDLRAEMKLNEAQFQNTGDSTTYYQTKLDLLSQELEANRQKQEALRSEIEVAKQVYGENSDEVKKLETSLTYAQVQEENLKKQVTDTSDAMKGQATATDDAANSFDAFAQLAAAAGLTEIVKEIAEAAYELASAWEDASAAIVEGTGATGEALEDLQSAATDAFTSIADADITLSDVAEALAEVNTRFGLTGDAAEELTTQIVNFANHTGTDAVSAVDSIANITQRWGLDISDADALLDDLVTASQSCQMSVSDLSGYLASNSVQFQELGYSTEDALALLVSLSDGGANVSTVMSGMTKAVSNLSEVTDDVPGAFELAISTISECESVSEALQAQIGDTGLTVEDVFGTKAAQELATNIQNGNFNIEEWTAALQTNAGALDSTTESATTMQDNWAQAMNSMSSAFSETFSPAVTAVVNGLAEVITNVATIIADSPVLQAVLAAVVTALALLAAALAISSLIKGITTAFSALNIVMNANPIVLIVTLIAALVMAFITLWNNCDGFREFWQNLWEGIKNVFNTVKEAIVNGISAIGEWFSNIWSNLTSWYTNMTQKQTEFLLGIWEKVSGWFSDLIGKIVEWFTNIKNNIVNAFNAVKEKIQTIWTNIKDWLTNLISNIVSGIKEKFTNIKDTVVNIFTAIKTKIQTIWNAIWTTIKNVINKILSGVETWINGIINAINKLLSGINSMVNAVGSAINSLFGTSIGEIDLKISTVSLPRLAEGGIATAPMIAEIGEGKEPEAVTPISVLQDYIQVAVDQTISNGLNAVAAAIESIAGRPIYVSVDGQVIAAATAGYMDTELAKVSTRKARA